GWFARRDGDRFAMAGTADTGTRLRRPLLARRVAGCADPWRVLTDPPAAAAGPCGSARRSWVEAGFKVLTSGGWNGQRPRMTAPARASRMWVALAAAAAWPIEVGGRAEFEPRAGTVPRFRPAAGRRPHRVFRVGLGLTLAGLLAGAVRRGRLAPEPWPAPVPIPPVTEDEFLKRPTYPS